MSEQKRKIQAHPPKWQICTEGVTEANYLKQYIKVLNLDRNVTINCKKMDAKGCGKQHEALLDKMQECGRNWNTEATILVHDYDRAAERLNEKESFSNTFRRAKEESDYKVIYSNPCFEYWLMLHTAYMDSDLHRHSYQRKVKAICNQKRKDAGLEQLHGDDYKADPMLFDYFGGYEGSLTARRNAQKRFDKEDKTGKAKGSFSTTEHAKGVPCTNFFELLDSLDEFAAFIRKSGCAE